jgi:hypothetical protein
MTHDATPDTALVAPTMLSTADRLKVDPTFQATVNHETQPDNPKSTDNEQQRWRPCGGGGRPGGTWKVMSRTQSHVAITLCTCVGGEEVQRLTSADADLIAFLNGRSSSEQ